MKQEFFVWTNKTRIPSISDICDALAAAGFPSRVAEQDGGENSWHWKRLELATETEGQSQSCTVTAATPSREDIEKMVEDYEDLPFQVKGAARKYTIVGESDEYGQPTLFQLRVVATIAKLTHGVVEDPQESGLMLLDEFEAFIAST